MTASYPTFSRRVTTTTDQVSHVEWLGEGEQMIVVKYWEGYGAVPHRKVDPTRAVAFHRDEARAIAKAILSLVGEESGS